MKRDLSSLLSGATMPGDEASFFVRQQLGGGDQLPQYEPEGWKNALIPMGYAAAGMAPGGGLADAAGQLGGPSIRENWNSGNYGSAALQGVGVAGDAAYLGGPLGAMLGTAVKAALPAKMAAAGLGLAKTSKKFQKGYIAQRAEEALPNLPRTPDEARFLSHFGSKGAFESDIAARTQAAMDAGASEDKVAKGAARDPLAFRNLFAAQGEQAVMDAANAGEHLRPKQGGGFVGAPMMVQNMDDLNWLRQTRDARIDDAAHAIDIADPGRLGNWYDRSREYHSLVNEPHLMPQGVDTHAVYSQGRAPDFETAKALEHMNSRAVGSPTIPNYPDQASRLDRAAENAATSGAPYVPASSTGAKTGEYRNKVDPQTPLVGPFGTNDFRAGQSHGFTTSGTTEPFQGTLGGNSHIYMDGETALTVDRLNQSGLGGITWDGAKVQEVPWIYDKAQDYYRRQANKYSTPDPLEGMQQAVRDANSTPLDYAGNHTGSMTYEYAPSVASGHRADYFSMTPEEKAAFDAQGSWTRQMNGDPNSRDAIYSALGFRQQPPIQNAPGYYVNSLDQGEFNNVNIARPMLDMAPGAQGDIADATRRATIAAERFRGLNDAQEAVAGNLPYIGPNGADAKNSLLFDTQAPGAPGGTQPSGQQLQAFSDLLKGEGEGNNWGVTSTNRGALLMPFNPEATPADLLALRDKLGGRLNTIMPEGAPTPARGNTFFEPAFGRWGENGVEAVPQYTGEATTGILQSLANAPESVALNLSEDEGIRSAIVDKIMRDQGNATTRGDLQNTRKFFAEAPWHNAVDAMRKGAGPAAAVGALGYSLNAMADERR